MEKISFFVTTMPSTRPADYHLGYLDGCVYIDFNNYNNETVYLKRISFDGYGCCELGNNSIPLSIEDSVAFKNNLNDGIQNQDLLFTIIKKHWT